MTITGGTALSKDEVERMVADAEKFAAEDHKRREVAEAELTAWVAARSPRMAADELARLLRRTDEPAHRALALFALRCNGERRDSARIRDGGRPLVAGRGPRTGPLAIRARDAAGR